MVSLAYRRTVLGALALLLLAAVAGSSARADQAPARKSVSAKMVYLDLSTGGSCQWQIGVRYGNAAGASSYLIEFWDGYGGGQEVTRTINSSDVSATDAVARRVLPKGSHFLGYTGSGPYPKPADGCNFTSSDPTENGRFSKGAKAWAIFPPGKAPAAKKPRKHTISGTVVSVGCADGPCPLAGVTVTAAGSGAGGSAQTDAGGAYSIKVDDGRYSVTPTLRDSAFDPPSRPGVVVNGGDVGNVDFETCDLGSRNSTLQRTARAGGVAASPSCGTLAIDWSMPPRIDAAGWNAAEPSAGYLYPKGGWSVELFTTGSDGKPAPCRPKRTYTWTVSPRGTTQTDVYGDRSCKLAVKVPRLGVYTVTLEERAAGGKVVARAKKDVIVQDFLIVGAGDSNGSGQGSSGYWNRQCDRATTSYQHVAAQYVEDADPRSSVTFVHVACSGARTVHIASESYVGQEPDGVPPVQPQMVALRAALRQGRPVREIDAVILSIGINDLRFGGIILTCMVLNVPAPLGQGKPGCEDVTVARSTDGHGEPTFSPSTAPSAQPLSTAVAQELAAMPRRYKALESALKRVVTVAPERVFITTYPDASKRSAGVLCDDSSGNRPRLFHRDWVWLDATGRRLNQAVAATHAAEGWTVVGTIPGLFTGHGYCVDGAGNWFQSLLGSRDAQGNVYGTFHAKPIGHVAMGNEVVKALCPRLFPGTTDCKGGKAREPAAGSIP